ncbi:hypothetical protein SLA2020_470510 [Shorea laevis]
MASNVPVDIAEDDEEFDWEEAVRQIDEACQSAKPSTSSLNYPSSHFVPPPVGENSNGFRPEGERKPGGSSRQSTLDRFMGRVVGPSRPSSENHRKFEDRDPECVVVEGDERVPSIDIDAGAAKTWIYPVNIPLRDYQFAITKTALFSNTLVALPTGLGKTLIAAVIMYNYFRWFPDGKIVFAAPSRPLVMQQIEACHNIVGIPQEWTIDMTGQISPTRRACFWKTKRVFFVTPQVLEKDIQSGTCLVKYLVCLVIDEAHRALGNYSYCVAVRELMTVPVQLRILALTATPGSKQQSIQKIIDNLQISTLEYRDESDHDVIPYVHNRTIELIEVALGKDAVEINKKLLDVIRPFVARLSAIGVLQNRDYQTLTPVDLLNSRDRFRQAPPSELPHVKHGEVEACFGVLITLYHIRKLLSSHGIRPAYEMLEEKLQNGAFLRMMSKNEELMIAKLLMQQNLSHGAPSPKLSKMLEVLSDHFKTKGSQNSRVIIFSNFRGSVRDIMHALATVGDLVKATEFIGQSSGKALKGQSQKVQQAVLEKFRAGGYNVIVATSIGEEGLDIMEVDLVICFDANVSPLRMIQRMGRTGRKHDGRAYFSSLTSLLVLACEGSEIKGYMRKQANNRSIKKHMQNGGLKSFNFHSSPRMIPHIFKPEVQFVELSIEQFIPRGKKLKDDHTVQSPPVNEKLTPAETDLIAKYFHPAIENAWRPSLIAFPNFQAFPSKVHRVMHSCRTGMLIDSMQALQGLTFMGGSRTSFIKDEVFSVDCLEFDGPDGATKDSPLLDGSPTAKSQRKVTDLEVSPIKSLRTKCYSHCEPQAHSCLFSSDFISVDSLGKVMILSVPSIHFKHTSSSNKGLQNSVKLDSSHLKTPDGDYCELTTQAKAIANLTTFQTRCSKDDTLPSSRLDMSDSHKDEMPEQDEKIPESPMNKGLLNGDSNYEIPDIEETKVSSPLAEKDINDFRDAELSPRLTNLIKSGVVPESPVTECRLLNNRPNECQVSDIASLVNLQTELPLGPVRNEGVIMDNSACKSNISPSSISDEIRTPLRKMNEVSGTRLASSSLAEEAQTPLQHLTDGSGSKSWHLSSGEKSVNAKQAKKFKRLRKVGNSEGNRNSKSMKVDSFLPIANLARSFPGSSPIQMKHGRCNLGHTSGKKKLEDDVRTFIDEEAEVSSDTEISGDEEDGNNDSYDDSFIDDRVNLTGACTQTESGGVDMMAVYRRSLLSQSPMERQRNFSVFSPDSVDTISRVNGDGNYSSKTLDSLKTPQTDSIDESAKRNSDPSQKNQEKNFSEPNPSRSNDISIENEREVASRKRRLSPFQAGSLPAINLEREFSLQSEAAGDGAKESVPASHQIPSGNIIANEDEFDDDQFFESIDFDAIEAEATSLFKSKSESSVQKQEMISPSNPQNLASPSFDLGMW